VQDRLLFWITPGTISPWELVLSSSLIGVTILLVLVTGCLLHLNRKVRLLRDRHDLYSILIDDASEARCWWPKEREDLEYSYGLILLMGLDPQHPVSLRDIVDQFSLNDAPILDHSIRRLREANEPFEVSLTLIDEKTILKAVGYAFSEAGRRYFVLSFSDVTDEDFLLDKLHTQVSTITAQRNFYLDILDNLPLAIWGRDPQAQLIYCNQVFAGILETTPELVLKEGQELVDKNRSYSPYALAQRALATETVQSERCHIVIEGQRRMVEMAELPLANKRGTIGYALDFTEHEDAHITLAKHVATHQEILHNLSTPIVMYGADTRLEFFNKAYERLFEFEEKYLYSKPTFAEIMQNLRERRKIPEVSDFTAYKNSQLSWFNTLLHPVQEMMHLPDGQTLRLAVSPHPLGGLLFLYDNVTDKLALERRYNTLIAVQKETLDHLHEGIIVLGSDNRLRLSNPALARIWQIENIELSPGRHGGDIIYEVRHRFTGYSHWNQFRQTMLEMFNTRQPTTEQLILSDQSILTMSYVPLPDGSHLLGFVDVSDRWRFEEALRERNTVLKQADQFKSDFITHVSYELQAPLNTIVGFTEILLNQYFGRLNEQQIEYCKGINVSSHRLLSLTDDIIDLASVEAGQLTLTIHSIDLKTFLESLITLVYNRSNDHGLTIICEDTTSVKRFLADERRLKQAMFNLMMNAIKFTPAGGTIQLRSDIDRGEEGDCLVLSVSDTGIGLSEDGKGEREDVILEGDSPPTSRIDEAGIGLPLAKSLIELHGGDVRLQSKKGEGTTVACRIPLMEEGEGKFQ
jgi:signal transduction histidine kinase